MRPIRRLVRALGRRLRPRPGAPQLRLRLEPERAPQPVAPPTGCDLRRFAPGDEGDWLDLLDDGGELGPWTRQRLASEALAYLVPGTQWFVWCGPVLAAGAGVYERSPAGWEVGWVATRPEYRRRGLGRCALTAAALSALSLPRRPVWLFTDDHRDAAMRLYLRAGFEPDAHHPSHPKRWRAVLIRLGPEFAGYLDALQL